LVGISVTVEDDEGRSVRIVCQMDTTIAELKRQVEKKLGIPASMQHLSLKGKIIHQDGKSLNDLNVFKEAKFKVTVDLGMGAGGRMKQQIHEDPNPHTTYDRTRASRVFIHFANSFVWKSVTGKPMPPSPVTAADYTKAGLPWFKEWEKELQDVAPSEELAGVKSVAALLDISCPMESDMQSASKKEKEESWPADMKENLDVPESSVIKVCP